jgi:hypothetical protein
MVQVSNRCDDIVVKLELLKPIKPLQVVDLNDILIRKGQMCQLPQLHVLLIVDLVLSVVVLKVLPIRCLLTTRILSYLMRESLMTVGLTVSLSFSVFALLFRLFLISYFIIKGGGLKLLFYLYIYLFTC